ncbi:MAG TPA: hypothetical protein VMS43_06785 [Allosphingosinicella sp.]|nr:hypothetical protein [Allosphingosinicella sp.]
MGERVRLGGTGRGAHSAWYDEAGGLVVEWHDFGEDAPYESANMIRFDVASQDALAGALDSAAPPAGAALLDALAARFRSYFEIRAFADAEAIPFDAEVDFRP